MEGSLETVFATHQSPSASNSSISSGFTSTSATSVNKSAQEKRLEETRSLFVVHPFSWSKVHLTEYDDSCTTVNERLCHHTQENILINRTGPSPKLFSPPKDKHVEFGVSLQEYPGVGVIEEKMIERPDGGNRSLGVSEYPVAQKSLSLDNDELVVVDTLELQNHECYFLTPLTTDVESNQDDADCLLSSDWESLILYEKSNHKYDSYVDDPQHDDFNNNVSNVSLSTMESWSECSLQRSLLSDDCENINFTDSRLSLNDCRSTDSDLTRHSHGCTAVSFIGLHNLFRPFRVENEGEYGANTETSLPPENENLGDVVMCSLDSIDKVLAVQNEDPNLFEQMREICMKRFTCFGTDNLTESLSTLHINVLTKAVSKGTNSRTVQQRMSLREINSSNTEKNDIVDDCAPASWKATASFDNREVSYQSTLTPTPSMVHNLPSKEIPEHNTIASDTKKLPENCEQSVGREVSVNKKKSKLNITPLTRKFVKINNPKFWIPFPKLRWTKTSKSNAIFKLFQRISKKIQNLRRK